MYGVPVLATFILSGAIQGMVNVLQNYSILEFSESTHPCRSGLSNTRGTERGIFMSVDISDVQVNDVLQNDLL